MKFYLFQYQLVFFLAGPIHIVDPRVSISKRFDALIDIEFYLLGMFTEITCSFDISSYWYACNFKKDNYTNRFVPHIMVLDKRSD